ncbi:MAG TPA: hypothetical protein VJQ82_16440, partial [Terriglobales bacterium]|nr:hypothetical protein [Terriglobales bacterium]
PIQYMAHLFTAGDEEKVVGVYRKLMALRLYKRAETVRDIDENKVHQALEEAKTSPQELEDIYHLSAIAPVEERYVIPPMLREVAIEMTGDTHAFQEERGAGLVQLPTRGW